METAWTKDMYFSTGQLFGLSAAYLLEPAEQPEDPEMAIHDKDFGDYVMSVFNEIFEEHFSLL